MPYESDRYCFACGEQNPIGLHLQFTYGEGSAEASFIPERSHQGYPGLLHGGLVATLLDEAMAHAVFAAYGPAVTGELRVRLRGGGAPLGRVLRLRGWIRARRGRLVLAEAHLRDEAGTLLAYGEGKFMLAVPVS
ncbi:MAG: PaaI family thioesterase [Chloroflexia bacterium]